MGLLPRSVKIPEVPYDRSAEPLYTGGFADVWKVKYNDYHVAVKVLRVFGNNNFKKIIKVGSCSLSETVICKLIFIVAELLQRGCGLEVSATSERATTLRSGGARPQSRDGLGVDG